MFGLLALGFAGFVVLAVLGLVFGAIAMGFWLLLLPFRLLGFVFKALGALLFLPVLLLVGLVLAAVVGIPLLFVALVPALPIVLIVLGIWWLTRRHIGPAATVR